MKANPTLLSAFLVLLIQSCGYGQYVEDDWTDRDTWMDVENLFEAVGLKPGNQVADIGCHEGYLTIHLAKKVGTTGKVFAVDVRADRLKTLENYLKHHQYSNIRTILGDYDNPKLPRTTLDAVFIVDTYHEMKDYMTILSHVKRSLRPGGRILILEKLKDRIKGKSRAEQTAAHSLAMHYVKQELHEVGFTILKEVDDFGEWENDPTKIMWFLVAVKNPTTD
ncbi:class I SAM-dependent methyltransferase [Sungkyunkwania multivorans]|uniref:Class I SAM-dependent methyltransferase n=1 Tax=Sungkyunkwania multivorans TaxID=1173618 RepID=A0ABW3CW83_9FLAO